MVPGTISYNRRCIPYCHNRVSFNRRVFRPGFVDDQKCAMMKEVLIQTFMQFYPCANEANLKFVTSRDTKGTPFFYVSHGKDKIKFFQDRVEFYGEVTGKKGEQFLNKITFSQIAGLTLIYSDGTIFM